MVVYNLACEKSHRFEGWFTSMDDFAAQESEKRIGCPVCGSSNVIRQPSAPYVNTRSGNQSDMQPPSAPTPETIGRLREMFLEHVLKNTEDVGNRFPDEARKIHYKDAPARAIRGKASPQEAGELREEGIEVHPLPALPVPPEQLH
ncbi:MAG: DUF1178 family protein [Burkholderiales bacterium]